MADSTGLVALCTVDDVNDEEPRRAEHAGRRFAVYQVDGAYYVTQDLCTHGPGWLSDGYLEDGEVECPIHQGRFSVITGKPTAAPCTDSLKIWPVTVQDGKICIDPNAGTIAES